MWGVDFMLVVTQYETIDSIESTIQDYVQERLNTQVYELELSDEYSLDDSRLELSSSVKTVDCNSNNAVLGIAELSISDCGLSEIKPSITDLLPLELRQEFLYENRVTDSDRTLLLRKNLNIVTIIQQIQDELQGISTMSDDDIDNTLHENCTNNENDIEESNLVEFIEPTEIVEPTLISNMPDDIDLELADLDEFSLDDDTENSVSDEFSLDDDTENSVLDEFSLDDDTENSVLDEFSLDDVGTNDLGNTTNEQLVEDDLDDLDEFEPSDSAKDLNDVDETDEIDEICEPSEFVDEPNPISQDISEIDTDNELNDNIENDNSGKSEYSQGNLSELEIFKSIITKNTDTRTNLVTPKRSYIEENPDLGLEDLESVSEDDIDETSDLTTDLLDDEIELDTQLDDVDGDGKDIEEFEDDNDGLDEIEESEETLAENIDDIDFTDESEESIEHTEFIDKVEDNVDFVDAHNVSMSKPNIDTTTVVPKSELGRILTDKANSDQGVYEKRTFLQEFDKNIEQSLSKAATVKDFKDRMRGNTPQQVRAPASVVTPSKKPTDELPPLRTYLKKHPYTLIEDLLKLGYSNVEIQDGVKRGKFVKKNGMLRALY